MYALSEDDACISLNDVSENSQHSYVAKNFGSSISKASSSTFAPEHESPLVPDSPTHLIHSVHSSPGDQPELTNLSRLGGELIIAEAFGPTYPRTNKEAVAGSCAVFWKKVIGKGPASQGTKATWKFVPRSATQIVLSSRGAFTKKRLPAENSPNAERAKARVLAGGFQRIERVEYRKTSTPVVEFATLCVLLFLFAHLHLKLHEVFVVTAFLTGELDEETILKQPFEHADSSKPGLVCKLQKTLYYLKQAPGKGHDKMVQLFIGELGLKTACSDLCL